MEAGRTENTENLQFFKESRNLIRNIRESIVEVFIALARAVFFWLPGGDVAKGQALMTFHATMAFVVYGMFFFFARRSPVRMLIALFCILVVGSQIIFRGCVITRAEQRLMGTKDTIVDQFLVLMGIPVNRDTRYALTIGSSASITPLILCATVMDYF